MSVIKIPKGTIYYRVWLFTWFETKCISYFTDFDSAYDFAKASGEAWMIVRLSDFAMLAQSRIPIRRPEGA